MSKVAKQLGMEVFSIDNEAKYKPSLVADMEFVKPSDIPFVPNFIWASPPCTTYSMAAVSKHRNEDGTPKTAFAHKSDRLVERTRWR